MSFDSFDSRCAPAVILSAETLSFPIPASHEVLKPKPAHLKPHHPQHSPALGNPI
jgi:hypothetical protein